MTVFTYMFTPSCTYSTTVDEKKTSPLPPPPTSYPPLPPLLLVLLPLTPSRASARPCSDNGGTSGLPREDVDCSACSLTSLAGCPSSVRAMSTGKGPGGTAVACICRCTHTKQEGMGGTGGLATVRRREGEGGGGGILACYYECQLKSGPPLKFEKK